MKSAHQLIFHSLASKFNTLAIDIDIVREVGFDGLETSGSKIKACLDAGISKQELRAQLANLTVPGIGFLTDVERQNSRRLEMLNEAERLCELATTVQAKGIEAITGPLSTLALEPRAAAAHPDLYRGLVDLPIDEQIDLTAANLRAVADIAAGHNLVVYLEGLSWTPLNMIEKQLRVIETAARDNLRLVIDFWHAYTSGDTPEVLSKIDKNLIYGVHLCDSLPFSGGVPDEAILRNVPTGSGVLHLQEWVDAVKSTGFVGWWSCELFCSRQHQENSYEVAAQLKELMEDLIRR
ncbi:Sugar phosphate isomerase/epimerase [Rhizobium mongolense subsp. loessense]|uniref:Sugar phosphate isomerase/epimerase n=1 Tax=Rhizobium mongolense subsp. loessense TaxID=158890 RepID=A0A1G4U8A5_9HYPH|nr:sugar phosphate isomerase/epimerase family protein [Rhizobium mongolense]SCW88999.1 Sugar phosphate isomerase/epimerase [Rhizobium mongolense subsp. loessense]